MESKIHRAVQQTTKRGKRELEVATADVGGKPYMPRRGGGGGIRTQGSEVTGARTERVQFYQRRRPGKGKGKGKGLPGADDESE